jgi:1-deoxy-D-xylulose-5-phosphate reductoisomerase
VTGVAVLGCTGSIGETTFRVLEGLRQADDEAAWPVTALAAGRRIDDLLRLARRWQPRLVCAGTAEGAARLRAELGDDIEVVHGDEGLCAAARAAGTEVVVNGLVGSAGLLPTHAALQAGLRVAMANKEPIVMAGGLLLAAARAGGGAILPVDSEPSAMWQCLQGERRQDVRRYLLTASGGAFRDRPREELAAVTPAEALNHPTWSMGPKITVDSATLMNKGFEVIEAGWLFDVPVERIDVVLHRESIVHSMVEFVDGSVMAHLGRTDMAIPIQYALTHPARRPAPLSPLDVVRLGALHFEAPDAGRFPALDLCYAAGRAGGTVPTALNASNEVAVEAFLAGRIGFLDIHEVNRAVVDAWESMPAADIDSVLAADRQARERARRCIDERRLAA